MLNIFTHNLRIVIIVVFVAIILALLVIHPWNASSDSQSVIAKTESETSGVQSYRFSFSDSSLNSNGINTQQDITAEFKNPDRYHIKDTVDGQINEFIVIGNIYYLGSNFLSGPSTLLPQGLSYFYSKEAILKYLESLTDLQQLQDEIIEETECYHYIGKWDGEQQSSYTSSMKLSLELWIGKSNFLLRQLKIDGNILGDPEGTESININAFMQYYDFNQPLNIEAPLDKNGQLLPGWKIENPTSPN